MDIDKEVAQPSGEHLAETVLLKGVQTKALAAIRTPELDQFDKQDRGAPDELLEQSTFIIYCNGSPINYPVG